MYIFVCGGANGGGTADDNGAAPRRHSGGCWSSMKTGNLEGHKIRTVSAVKVSNREFDTNLTRILGS